jgi:APA family basic amino acid/polyamine antiporter
MNTDNPATIDESKIPLKRSFGLTTAILLVAGIIIGSGVFKKIAPMSAALMDKNYILLAWLLAGIITLLGAFNVAGLATMTDESGGIYEYLRLSFGNFFSFISGWTAFLIGGSGSIAALAFIFAESVNYLVPLPHLFSSWQKISIGNFVFPFASAGIKMLAVLAILLLTGVNILGAKKGGNLNNLLTASKVGGILLLIVAGLSFSHALPVTNSSTVSVSTNIFSGILAAMLSAFWAYDGWFLVGNVSGEIKNPKRNVPISLVAGVGISIILYVLLNEAFMHVLPLSVLANISEDNIAALEVAGAIAGNVGVVAIALLIVVCTFGALNAIIIAYPRLYYRMAQEKFFPKSFSFVHPRFRTPYLGLIYSMIWSCVLVISGTFDTVTNMIIFTEFFFSGLMAVAVIKMKRKGKITARVILYPLSPIIFVLFSLALLINTFIVIPKQSAIGLLFILSGVPVYFYYKKRKKITEITAKITEVTTFEKESN